MQSSLREDYLEAIQQFSKKNGHPPRYEELAEGISKSMTVVRADMEDLVSSGDVSIADGERIVLTGKGKQTGESVIKKHETLQCFLSEILGMDTGSASDEACTLEHTVSDETIDRLGQLIVQQEGQRRQRWSRRGKGTGSAHCAVEDCDCTCPSISDCAEGEQVIIHCIYSRASAKRLLDLGMVPGERAIIKRKLSDGALVVQIKGCDVALSPEIAAAIGVERSP
jgi:DtxR family transcriptional regulator, Mn-dependent transcriptional regulator